jgi:hypothetical protein
MAKATAKNTTAKKARRPAGKVITINEGIPLPGGSGMRTIPRVFEQPKERLHDRRGRPGASMQIIKREALRRVAADELPNLRKLSVFSRALCTWFRKTHPTLPQPTQPSVENGIRGVWGQRRESI